MKFYSQYIYYSHNSNPNKIIYPSSFIKPGNSALDMFTSSNNNNKDDFNKTSTSKASTSDSKLSATAR